MNNPMSKVCWQKKIVLVILFLNLIFVPASGQLTTQQKSYTHADTLRGSVTPQRAWWNVLHYDLHVRFNPSDSSLLGHNIILYQVLQPGDVMQIDLMQPLVIDSLLQDGARMKFTRDGNAFFARLTTQQKKKSIRS